MYSLLFFCRMVHLIAAEFLTDERDRKYYADHYTCFPPPVFIILITFIEVSGTTLNYPRSFFVAKTGGSYAIRGRGRDKRLYDVKDSDAVDNVEFCDWEKSWRVCAPLSRVL